MTTSASRLTPEDEVKMGLRLQACLDLAAKNLYRIIRSDRKILADRAKADSPEFLSAEERFKRFAVNGLDDGSLGRHLHALTQEVDHGFRILKKYGPPEGGAIADRFVEANQGLVGMIARRYAGAGLLSGQELMQIGQLGLILATLRYDPTTGRFSSFAYWWIKHFISRGLADIGRLIRLPVETVRMACDIEKEQRRSWQMHGRPPPLDELAKAVDRPLARVLEVMPHLRRPISIDAPNKDCEGDGATSHRIMASDALSPEAAVTERQTSLALQEHLARLAPMEQELIVSHLDLHEGSRRRSLDELGRRYGYSREGIRKVYLRALDKLRTWLRRDYGHE